MNAVRVVVMALVAAQSGYALAQEGDSTLVRLLKSGKLPPERQVTVLEMIGNRGSVGDVAYLYERALAPDGFGKEVRRKAFEALRQAALTRKVAPPANRDALRPLLDPRADRNVRLDALRLVGPWKVEALADAVGALAASPSSDPATRLAALDALVALGTPEGRRRIEALTDPSQPVAVRVPAVAALARLDPAAAAPLAAAALRDATNDQDLTPLVAAFVARPEGVQALARAIGDVAIAPDAAKLGLRALYALGRSDEALVAPLARAAGLDAEVRPFDKPHMDAFIAEVAEKGDPVRGEEVFRRVDLSCNRCHSLLGAGGGIGPELAPIGQSSPVDYIVNSILQPDQAIKEEFHTLVVLTADGQVFQGLVVDRDANRIILKEATGELRTVPTADIEESKEGGSLMPKGLSNLMTHAEFIDLVRFLSELGRPGPYAIRPVPSIQRWRVLRPVPDPLQGGVPRVEGIRTEILESSSATWAPAYALHSGVLPLADLVAATGESPILYLQGELHVTEAGPIEFRLNSPEGVHLWLNDRDLGAGPRFTARVAPGPALLTVRVEPASRKAQGLRVEVVKPPGSAAEFTVLGGP